MFTTHMSRRRLQTASDPMQSHRSGRITLLTRLPDGERQEPRRPSAHHSALEKRCKMRTWISVLQTVWTLVSRRTSGCIEWRSAGEVRTPLARAPDVSGTGASAWRHTPTEAAWRSALMSTYACRRHAWHVPWTTAISILPRMARVPIRDICRHFAHLCSSRPIRRLWRPCSRYMHSSDECMLSRQLVSVIMQACRLERSVRVELIIKPAHRRNR
jgi:hypothetical protein